MVPNPTDPMVVVIVGPGLFRLLSVSDTVWRQYGFQKADKIPICCVCWLNSDRVLAGTEDGRLIIVENGDLKGRYKACDFGEMDLQVVDEWVAKAIFFTLFSIKLMNFTSQFTAPVMMLTNHL